MLHFDFLDFWMYRQLHCLSFFHFPFFPLYTPVRFSFLVFLFLLDDERHMIFQHTRRQEATYFTAFDCSVYHHVFVYVCPPSFPTHLFGASS